ncbi:unnamed protein product [Calicophoron daubneyi]|uniref:Alpha-tubulin N-acetyltransferase n=1 Tax=Calicophoron daubneyi TaxID=300641 RepID=A0AAV2SZW5_CALDB
MEFKFNIRTVLPDDITCLTPKSITQNFSRPHGDSSTLNMVAEIIDAIGEHSAKAQRLPQTITTFRKFKSSNQRLYILSNSAEKTVLGFLKTGKKRLFMHDKDGNCMETEPLCVLDFYVHELQQRRGHGKRLFDHMLKVEQTVPSSLAIDSPSQKMLQFLKKHYKLCNPIFASNNYVVYPGFFNKSSVHAVYRDFHAVSLPTSPEVCDELKETDVNTAHSYSVQNADSNSNCASDSPPSTRRSIPHTRVQAMPTHLTVIRPETPGKEALKEEPAADQYHSPVQVNQPNPSDSFRAKSTNLDSSQSETNGPRFRKPAPWETPESKYSIVSAEQLNSLQSLKTYDRTRQQYSYANAVRHHNGHTRIW